jgi:hypothetical protein
LDDSQAGTNDKLEAALAYARRGWAVLPLWTVDARRRAGKAKCACGNADCPSPGKHPIGPLVPKGLKQATTDEEVIRRWWKAYPDANVGIATGKQSGIWAVDVDTIHEGDLSLEALLQEHGDLPKTPHSLTGGGGDHYVLVCPPDQEISNCKLAQGIDIKGENGYIVAPPSHHASGFDYAWEVTEHFEDVAPAEAPTWLRDMVQNRTAPTATAIPEVVAEWAAEMPPVPLPAWGMALWTGERVIDSSDGQEKPRSEATKVDRSETLWSIGKALKSGGADGPQIAAALANRDEALGYHKYSGRRNGFSAREYNRIAVKVLEDRPEPEGTPRLTMAKMEPDEPAGQADAEENQRWQPIPVSQLDPNGEHVEWVWEGYVAHGGVTELVGLWKSGKTTLVAHLIKAMETGGMFAGVPVSRAKVLYISEEHQSLWIERRDEYGLTDHLYLLPRPFLGKPNLKLWREFAAWVATLVRRYGFDVVVLDPFATLTPVEDENDAGEVTTAIVEFHRITDEGAALVVLHHPNKGGMGQGMSSRGSGALPGFVDVLLEFGRYDATRPDDTRRVLRGLSRYKETPAEVVIELDEDGYKLAGTRAEAKQGDREEVILSVLSRTPVSVRAIRAAWPADAPVLAPSEKSITRCLETLEKQQKVVRTGGGKAHDPFKFAIV